MALVPLQQVMRTAPPYHDKLFPQSGADHKSSVILFSTRVQSQDFFRMVTSHIWHRYIFWGCCVWLEAFLARFRHVSSVSHYVSTLTISQDYFLLYVWAPLQGPGYILVKHIIPLFGDFWLHWTLKIIPNILPRSDKTSETHSYISQTIPLIWTSFWYLYFCITSDFRVGVVLVGQRLVMTNARSLLVTLNSPCFTSSVPAPVFGSVFGFYLIFQITV